MARSGYIFVEPSDIYFQRSTTESIDSNVEQVLLQIEEQRGVLLTRLKFDLHSMARDKRSAGSVYKQVVLPAGIHDIRIVFTEDEPAIDIIRRNSEEMILLVSAFDSKSGESSMLPTGQDGIALAQVNRSRLPRFFEDIIIDITLANFFRQSEGPVKHVIDKHGVFRLYAKKVEYFHKRQAASWLNSKSNASYVPISSLVGLSAPGDRAQKIFEAWSEFVQSLLLRAPMSGSAPSLDVSALRSITKLGGQLKVSQIQSKISELPGGNYLLLVQTRSTIGKNPKTRAKLRHLFGRNSKPNSFAIIPKDYPPDDRAIIDDLARADFIRIIELT